MLSTYSDMALRRGFTEPWHMVNYLVFYVRALGAPKGEVACPRSQSWSE